MLLLSGAAGFIGSQMVRTAIGLGHRVVGLDKLTYAGSTDNVAGLPGDRFELVVGDICDADLVRDLLHRCRPTAVLNFAAETHVDRSIVSSDAFVQTNIIGTLTLLKSCLSYYETLSGQTRADFRYVQISTDEVYGSLGDEGVFDEGSHYRPRSPYAASKAAADHLVDSWHHTYGLPTIVTHCSNNYGPRQFAEKLIPHMITQALSGAQLPVYGNGRNVRDWIHVNDHCAGVIAALSRGIPGQHYCFGGNCEWRNIDLVNRVCDILDEICPRGDGASYRSQITFVTDRLGHDFRYAIDFARARDELGFSPSVDFAAGLRNTVSWYSERYKKAGSGTS